MINIDYVNGTIETPTIVLSNRNLELQGKIKNIQDFRYKGNMNSKHEVSFSVYKEVDGVKENKWNDIIDLKLIWIKETNMFYEIKVPVLESTTTVKKITGTSLGEAELSQILIRNTEINTENDIARPNYAITKFFNPEEPEGSLLHRVLSFAPHYSIKHVDASLWDIQRTFSIDEKSIYDFLTGECAEEIGCLFQFNSSERSISVYDLMTVCKDCGYRGEYLDVCPKCGSKNLKYYGEDTTIFVSSQNLTDEISLDTNVDAIKNCMKLKSGDEVMDAAIVACNPNGSSYIYYFSEEQKNDMPEELRNKLEEYDALVDSYTEEYQNLSQELYECIDKILYYKSGMMPTVEIPETNASTEVAKLTVGNLSPVGLTSVNTYTSTATVNSALKNYAKVFVKSGFVKIEIDSGNFVYTGVDSNGYGYGTWTGKFKVTNYSDEEDIAYSETLTLRVTGDYETFLNQKVLKNIASNNTDDDSVFKVLNVEDLSRFKRALTKYSYNRLESFADAIQGVINVLIEENQGRSDASYYSQMYTPYYNKLQACQAEMNTRSATIEEYEERHSAIIKQQTEIQKRLNIKSYLGEDLYKLFYAYRREDTYQNENFISDGLSNAEIFEKANEFIKLAKHEIVKSGEYQHSISSNLYNLLVMKEFAPIKDKFELGNWIRCKIDDVVYRLRLISYEINGSNLSSINTEFSDLTKTANGVNDVRSILKSAQSMATSYSYISKQAEQGKNAQDSISNALQEGLNSALVNIKNNDNEETVIDQNGITCKSWDDIADDYSFEQLRITHNILAFTDDNWKTSSLGLGKHDYYYYDDDKSLKKATGYGLSSKFVQAGYIWGSQIVGGEVFSENYSPTTGTYMDLNDGTFSFAGGKIKYDGDILSLSGVMLKWEDVSDAPTSLSEFENDTGFQTSDQVTTITENTIATTNVIAKNLKVQSANIEGEIVADSVAAENITGSTISGKNIVVGGENNGDGSIVVKDNSGNIICTIDVNGINIKSYAFKLDEGIDIVKGRYINKEYAPNLVELHDGFSNGTGSSTTSGTGYVGGHGAPNGEDQVWGVDTGNINVENFSTMKIGLYCEIGSGNCPGAGLRIYGDDVLLDPIYNTSNGNGIIFIYHPGSDTFGESYSSPTNLFEFDVSPYKTIRVEYTATSGSDDSAWVSIGFTSLYIC